MDNKYVNRAKISEYKFRELARLFALDLTATQIAELSGLNRNTVNRYLKGIRLGIADYCDCQGPLNKAGKEGFEEGINQSDFCVGICEKEGNIYTCIIDSYACLNAKTEVYCMLDVFVNFSRGKQKWLLDRDELLKKEPAKVSCISGFKGFLKSRLEKFKGIHHETYRLHLKESEFRFNNPKEDLYLLMLKIFRNDPLF
ncbi:helix-turn-helix transcriptional regulator [Fodinibius saliphilus]|uniref:helix-turn-helix transcriptional regulator n=1 Tax=Fodinibius saliphilus TaxID=1920650 RepID=UPI001108385B|nr:hypothetical protein [Fodinibius saliphilus]